MPLNERIAAAQLGSTHKRAEVITPADIPRLPDAVIEHPGSYEHRVEGLVKAIHALHALPKHPSHDNDDWS